MTSTPLARILAILMPLMVHTFVSADPATDSRFKGQQLHLLNWSDYLDPELAADFERRFGVTLVHTYFETDHHRDTLLAQGGIEGYDLAVVNSSALDIYRRQGWIAPFDRTQLVNPTRLDPLCRAAAGDAFDYSAPYFWGTIGIVYRTDLVEQPVSRWMHLFHPEETLRGHIAMIDDPVDVLGAAARTLGHSPNTEDADVWRAAERLAQAQQPYVHSYGTLALDETSGLVTGEIWMAQIFSGEALDLQEMNGDIRYVHPVEGSSLWVDHWVLLAKAPHPELAHAFLDFINAPSHAAANAESLHFATCNQAAEPLLPTSFRTNPVVYPPPEVRERLEPYGRLSAATMRRINMAYSRIRNIPAP